MPRRKHQKEENLVAKNFITWLVLILMFAIILWFLANGLYHLHSGA
jgi:hypothetical protein